VSSKTTEKASFPCPKCGKRDWKPIIKCGFILHMVCQNCGYKDPVMGYFSKKKGV
jgi:predicted RNA-binding Zn-ribbon protein involved in translation (DUF1610 family)